MNKQIILGLLFTILPVAELRVGLPLVIEAAKSDNLPILPYFFMVLALNIGVVFLVFLFLDFLHESFMKVTLYRKFMSGYIERLKGKGERLMKRVDELGYIALWLFVAIPLPGTGAWTGTFLAWILGLNRKKSIFAISMGVIAAGLIVLFLSLGFFRFFG